MSDAFPRALLHDATEAYVGDMVRPLKLMLPAYQEAEARVWAAIATKYRVDLTMPAEVKAADSRILLDERAAMMPNTRYPWDIEDLEPLGVRVTGWAPARAEHEFINRFTQLYVGS